MSQWWGNYLLVMFYTTIVSWMLAYFVKMLNGDFIGTKLQVKSIMFLSVFCTDPQASIFG